MNADETISAQRARWKGVTTVIFVFCLVVLRTLGPDESWISSRTYPSSSGGTKPDASSESISDVNVADDAVRSCEYGNGIGSFVPPENPNITFSWTWKLEREDCPVENVLEGLSQPESTFRGKKITKPLSFVLIGDSLDFKETMAVCRQTESEFLPFPWELPMENQNGHPARLNEGRNRNQEMALCVHRNHRFAMGQFKIFGMKRRCTNGKQAHREDTRESNTTAERLLQFLYPEVTSRLVGNNKDPTAIMVNSGLWDLSEGCNDQVGISESYEREYREGIHMIHDAIRKLHPTSHLYWRVSPVISRSYR